VPPPPTFEQPKGDFVHTAPAEEKIDTPLPIYVEGGPTGVYHVIVRYKSSEDGEDSEWNHMDLSRVAQGWGGLIPCNAIVAGTIRYYIQAYNKDMDPVGANGDKKTPYQVPIREELSGPAPHLPNRAPPRVCHQAEKPKPESAAPKEEKEEKAEKGEGGDEAKGEDEEGAEKNDKKKSKEPLRRWWIGVNVHLDFMALPSGSGLCKLTQKGLLANDRNIYCTDPSGADIPPQNMQGPAVNLALMTPAEAGVSSGGYGLANLRLFLSIDYALNSNFLVGVRGGYVFLKYPGTFGVPDTYSHSGAYLEARLTALIAKDALRKDGVAPMIFVGAGASAFDGHTSSTVVLRPASGAPAQPVNVDLWQSNGPAFADVGGGLRYAPIAQVGLMAAVRLNLAFGNNGTVPTFGPEVGVQIGF
jgi:hypothetical protein